MLSRLAPRQWPTGVCRKRTLGALVGMCLLGGCASTTIGVRPEEAQQLPADRYLFGGDVRADAVVVVVRDTGYLGSACLYGLYVNRQLAARFAVGEIAEFKVASGEVLLSAARDPQGTGLCSPSLDPTPTGPQRETSVKPGERKTFRLMIQPSSGPDVVRADF